jgi:hypothetical protein
LAVDSKAQKPSNQKLIIPKIRVEFKLGVNCLEGLKSAIKKADRGGGADL